MARPRYKAPAPPKRTAEEERRLAHERAVEEARRRWEADSARSVEEGGGGLVPGTRTEWQGLARMAHARRAAGVRLDDRDRHALELYPTPDDAVPASWKDTTA